MTERVTIEISGIVVVSTHKDYPVVGLGQTLGITFRHLLITVSTLKTESAIAGHNQESVAHFVLHAHLEYQTIEIAMNIARDDN
jgi:hypothetical protein